MNLLDLNLNPNWLVTNHNYFIIIIIIIFKSL